MDVPLNHIILQKVALAVGQAVYLSRRSDILEKPVLSLLAGALDSVAGGYEYEDMFRWLKTGLAGLSDSECDLLENYVIPGSHGDVPEAVLSRADQGQDFSRYVLHFPEDALRPAEDRAGTRL